MRVFDTFMFFEELDMLECRLTEFEELPFDVIHVIVEADVTHRGDPKPLVYQANAERFAKWADKIRYVVAELPGQGVDPWVNERTQRTHCVLGLHDAQPDDIVLHGDMDEIPRMSKLQQAIEEVDMGRPPCALVMRHHMYAVDWYHPNLDQALTIVARYDDMAGINFVDLRQVMGHLRQIHDAGWHLTWIGGHEANLRKLGVHCHLEMTDEERYWPESGRAWAEGRTHGGTWQLPVESLEDYPRYIRERRCPEGWFRPRG